MTRVACTLVALLLFSACAGNARPDRQASSPVITENWAEELHYASDYARGSKLCDRGLRKRYGALFEAEFGKRVERIRAAFEAQIGTAKDFITLSDCRLHSPKLSQAELDRDHKRRRAEFEKWLSAVEAQYLD